MSAPCPRASAAAWCCWDVSLHASLLLERGRGAGTFPLGLRISRSQIHPRGWGRGGREAAEGHVTRYMPLGFHPHAGDIVIRDYSNRLYHRPSRSTALGPRRACKTLSMAGPWAGRRQASWDRKKPPQKWRGFAIFGDRLRLEAPPDVPVVLLVDRPTALNGAASRLISIWESSQDANSV